MAFYSCFCTIAPFSTSKYQHQLGVLNSKAVSYSREHKVYYKDKEVLELILFRGVSGEVQNEGIPLTFSEDVLTLLSWMYTQATNNKFTDSKTNTNQLLVSEFTDGYSFTTIGEMVSNGQVYLPSHIEFTLTKNDVKHEFKIWFALANFLVEYPYRDIYVFGPVPPEEIDLLITSNYKELEERFAQETAARLETRVKNLIGDNLIPYTWRDVLTYDIYDTINKPHTTKGDWTIILWGNPLNAEDAINEAIKDCILKHTKYPETDWEDKVPDVFNPLEFFVVPHWNDKGLENETSKGSTYSPILAYQDDDTLAQKYADFYESSFIKSSLEFVPHLWKSIKLSIVGKPKNNLGQTTFSSVYPDYQLIPSTDSQVGMMSELTAEMVARIEDLLATAEMADENNIITSGVNKVTRKDRLYVSLKIDKVKFTCATRYQFIKDGIMKDE